jgi:S-formylglutathione hydrolase FrmB
MHSGQNTFHGRFEHRWIESQSLLGNPLGDPARRPLWVYLPPGYDDRDDRTYPSIYVLQGLTGQVDMWWNRSAFRPTTPEAIDALFTDSAVPPSIVVLVDAWTSLGGSQYVNSPGTGRYLDYLCDDVVPFVDATYRTTALPSHRGIVGKSSGGYGAMVVPMLRPKVFGALATHSGDALFEVCYLPDFRIAARALRDSYDSSFERFWEDFRSRPAFSKPADHILLNTYCMAACYSADADGSVNIPFDLSTGRLRQDVWQRWLQMDPVRMVAEHAGTLRGLRGIYIDAGRRDEVYLDLGATAFSRELELAGVDHHFELHDAGHSGVEYRYPKALRFLTDCLAASP